MEYTHALTDFIGKQILRGRAVNLNKDLDLLSAGIIDSLGVLRMVAFMEEELGIKVLDEDVVLENFHNIQSMARYVAERKRAMSEESV